MLFILGFLTIVLGIGLFIFRDYGASWDEPLFYKYADALGYAYTPANWFSGHFDLNLSYGPSADDHKNRGPAYLLLAREAVYLLETVNIQSPEAWHLVNFLTFLLGAYFLYNLCLRWMSHWPALAATAIFVFQPLLWGHAFINPKDLPFLVSLVASIYLGLRMVDRFPDRRHAPFWDIALASFALGISTSVRVLGPLAGLLVLVYFLTRHPTRQTTLWMGLFALLAMVVAVATWPYLWENPALRFVEVSRFMSSNPTTLSVLFNDQVYQAHELPRRYLPFYLFYTLTEPVWPLFLLGTFRAGLAIFKRRPETKWGFLRHIDLALMLAWLILPVIYVLLFRPPIYDGFRHFFFILPPVFVFIGLALEFLFNTLRGKWLNVILAVACSTPGLLGIVQLHPYEYTYYNAFIGGTGGAFRHYETDYWLTCYKEAIEQLNRPTAEPATLYVHREAGLAGIYAPAGLPVKDERGASNEIKPGDYVLVNTRTNEDLRSFRDAPQVVTIGRMGATFCVIKKVP